MEKSRTHRWIWFLREITAHFLQNKGYEVVILTRSNLKTIDKSAVYNATGPVPVTNKEFMSTLRKVMGKGWTPPAPSPFVWLGAFAIVKTEPSLALIGQKIAATRIPISAYRFRKNVIRINI
jgi:NAD dependent epimerase/dehydratase family enzyme